MVSPLQFSMNLYHKKIPKWVDPESIFTGSFAKKEYSFWLDSSKVEKGLSRFSFMGDANTHIRYSIVNKNLIITENGKEKKLQKSIFDFLEGELLKRQGRVSTYDLPFDFVGGFVGYFGYELQSECGSQNFHTSKFPDAYFLFVDRFIAFDHEEKEMYLVCLSENEIDAEKWFHDTQLKINNYELQNCSSLEIAAPACRQAGRLSPRNDVSFTFSKSHDEYIRDIISCQEYLQKGESYQICLTNQIVIGANNYSPLQNALDIYKNLRQISPAPYSAYLRFGNFAILASSPEMFLKIDRDRKVTSKPIKGTIQRGKNEEEDKKLASQLGKNDKYFAENAMIVDLVRNDLGKVCNIGSVHVTKFLDVETYATMHQLVSTITGTLRDDRSVIDAIKALFPGGSMTGAPKLRAMEIIAEIEKQARGIYSGALGFLSFNGTAELNIIIRSIIATEKELQFGAGGAILVQSDAKGEYQEMLLKTKALTEAILANF